MDKPFPPFTLKKILNLQLSLHNKHIYSIKKTWMCQYDFKKPYWCQKKNEISVKTQVKLMN
jgi:hypothetical protein